MTLYNDYDINYREWFEQFEDFCKENDIDSTQYNEDSEYFINWVYDRVNMDWDDLITNIEYSSENVPCIVIGNVGTWRGVFEIEAKRFETLESAIIACVSGCDTIITEDDGVINVVADHHDGKNSFSIYKLNDKGLLIDFDDENIFDINTHTEKFSCIY